MAIIDELAHSLNRRDEVPNQLLAKKIADKKDKNAVKELIALLSHKSKDIRFDVIKVLYEIGEQQPSLITAYAKHFIALLDDKDNRNIWGAMHALDSITPEDPKLIYSHLSKIMDIAEKGSVITRDHTVGILIKLGGIKAYTANAFSLLMEILKSCPTNQLPMYAENATGIITAGNKTVFIKTLKSRLTEIEKETKRKRVEKVIKRLS